jgi:CDP-glucose 4,6-dehydratase
LWGYRETDPLGGYDPYSSSKACAEIVSAAYRQSYFPVAKLDEHRCAIATARAGNVIGGGDWSTDRLIPDLIRGFIAREPARIRSPRAIRPWQHVLEPLYGYILLAENLLRGDARFATAFNFGPFDDDTRPVGWIADRLVTLWGNNAAWIQEADPTAHEANFLKLDASRAHAELAWRPRLRIAQALEWLADWYKAYQDGADMQRVTIEQIVEYESLPPVD